MLAITLIFPHQLYRDNPAIDKSRKIILIEEYLFFNLYRFHKQKLILHRASMQFYFDYLKAEGYDVEYLDNENSQSDIRIFFKERGQQIKEIHLANPSDNWLQKRIKKNCASFNIKIYTYPSPKFINNTNKALDFFKDKKNFSQTSFYIQQRKQNQLFVDNKGKPAGGKWTYDEENRKRFPAGAKAPDVNWPPENKWVAEARQYIEKLFPENCGNLYFSDSDTSFYPVTFDEAENWFSEFLLKRFENFGIYEDAIVASESVLNHSVLTPALNIGLITPSYILERTAHASEALNIPLNSTEGFIRQILGWREFMHLVYVNSGTTQRNSNFWNFTRKIPVSFWKGETGILPLDYTIHKALKRAYCHHIERLMILGNFMLLCEFDPHEVYHWFMELFIDAYDWVMVPNIYGMSQFADGGLMSTKPYFSGSNYLLKMSNYPKGEWQEVWDGLFWRFTNKHNEFLRQNPRFGMVIKIWEKMPVDKKERHLLCAEAFLSSLDK